MSSLEHKKFFQLLFCPHIFGPGSAYRHTVYPPVLGIRLRIHFGRLDPDPQWENGSGSVKITHKSARCSLSREENFSCILGFLYGGPGISKLLFLITKYKFFPAVNLVFLFLVIKTHPDLDPDSGFKSGSELTKNAGPGSALASTLISAVPECGWAGRAGGPHRLLALTPLKLPDTLRHAQTPLSDHLLSSLFDNSCCCCCCCCVLIIIAVEEVGRWRREELHAAARCCAVAAHLKQQEKNGN
jgi:hypothetical protein